MSDSRTGYPHRVPTPLQRKVLDADLSYDDGGRYVVIATSGWAIPDETFGVVFSLIDCATGDEIEQSRAVKAGEARDERRHWIGRARHLNGLQDPYAA